jgi:hypothetical protein
MKWLIGNLTLSKKLLIAPMVVMAFLMALGLLSYNGLTSQKATIETIFGGRFKSYQTSAGLIKETAAVHASLYKVINWANAKYDDKKIDQLGK